MLFKNRVYNQKLSIKQWAEEDRPREKLMLKGKANLSNAELLAIIIGSGYKDVSAVGLAKMILSDYDQSISRLARLNVSDFKKYKGIGEVKALSIVAALEIGRRREKVPPGSKKRITSSSDAFEFLKPNMSDLNHEEFRILLLNRNNVLIKIEIVSIGGVSGTVVDPKIVFKKALDNNSCSIILAHNHPSGNVKPSDADIRITDKLVRAGNNLDIKVLDHLIIGDNEYYSFADEGRI